MIGGSLLYAFDGAISINNVRYRLYCSKDIKINRTTESFVRQHIDYDD